MRWLLRIYARERARDLRGAFNVIRPRLLPLLLPLLLCRPAHAQTNAGTARIAIVVESRAAAAAGDLLTAEFSGQPNVELLERAEIEKVYREQRLSAGNRDYLKLGQMLGADGLLILSAVAAPTNQSPPVAMPFGGPGGGRGQASRQALDARLIAVKPGVVLRAIRSSASDSPEWAQGISKLMLPDLPKLKVPAGEAIPISLVNLRCAVSSAEAVETEAQLKALTIERLSREPKLFVLERERMQLLSGEKELNRDESPFWTGRHLLEGVVDQNGYSKQTITINARLTPPRGGAPVTFEVSGSRTNLPLVINALAAKVVEALKINGGAGDWNAREEAGKFFEEAQWALKWKVLGEARAAADSAWALGKQDLECASVRVRSYMVPSYHFVEKNGMTINYVEFRKEELNLIPLEPRAAQDAARALELYLSFGRTLPPGDLKADSAWCRLGVDDLVSASRVLEHFRLVPKAQTGAEEWLRDVRATARAVAELIASWPAVRDTYYVGDRIANHDTLVNTVGNGTNIFNCKLLWGCYWAERPEETLEVYRELMASPVFCYLHQGLWKREHIAPRLVAWNRQDEERIPGLWKSFVAELEMSTNVLWRMEAKALAIADAANEEDAKEAKDEWLSLVRAHRAELVANNVELFYLGWGVAFNPETEAMDREYWEKTVQGRRVAPPFEEQKKYLAALTPYDFQQFMKVFALRGYSPEQATEILPLITAYKSNVLAHATPASNFQVQHNAHWIEIILEKPTRQMTNPPAPTVAQNITQPEAKAASDVRPPPSPLPTVRSNIVKTAEQPENALLVTDYLRIPLKQLNVTNVSGVTVTGRRWSEGKLVLPLWYEGDSGTNYHAVAQAAAAVFDPENRTWDFARYPIGEPRDYTINNMLPAEKFLANGVARRRPNFELFEGGFYVSDAGEIKKFDFKTRQWTTLNVPERKDSQFFVVNGHLFAANEDCIFELTDGGQGSRLLAGVRRRPAVSTLDSRDTLGTVTLFAGPDGSLRAWINGRVFGWVNGDWHDEFALNSQPPETFASMTLARGFLPSRAAPGKVTAGGPAQAGEQSGRSWNHQPGEGLWALGRDQVSPELCMVQMGRNTLADPPPEKPLWKSVEGLALSIAPIGVGKSNLYLLAAGVGQPEGPPSRLVCLVRGVPDPIVVPLKFDTDPHPLPADWGAKRIGSARRSWMCFSDRALYIGSANVPGVWSIPLVEIEKEIAARRKPSLGNAAR